MRNLIQFFVRFHAFFIFLVLEAICMFLVIRNHNYQRTATINATNAVTGGIFKTYSNFTDYLHLKEINDSLQQENARLLAQLPNAKRDNEKISDVGCDEFQVPAYKFIEAKVISNSIRKANNYIVIDRGSNQGIKPNMGVIITSGIVGIVKDVSPNFSSVISMLHKDTKVSVRLKQQQYTGSLVWPGHDPSQAVVNGIPKHVKINLGDTLVTSGFSAIFPANIMVGKVADFSLPPGSNFYEINLTLSANLATLRYVYVINYLFREERNQLEQQNDN